MDWTVSLGTLIHLGGIGAIIVAGWVSLKSQVVLLEDRAARVEHTVNKLVSVVDEVKSATLRNTVILEKQK